MPTNVYCLADHTAQANDIVHALRDGGFPGEDISVLFPDVSEFARLRRAMVPQGFGAGDVVGGTLGWLAGIGVLTIAGVGPFVAAGPVMALLSGTPAGAAGAGISACLLSLGMPEYAARRYEAKIKNGEILIAAIANNLQQIGVAKDVFIRSGGTDIGYAEDATGTHGSATNRWDRPAHFPSIIES
jgi:hypothetical protein